MKTRLILGASTALLAFAALPAAADQAPMRNLRNDADAPIVVTGQRPSREEARERATTFVRQIGVARGDIAAARWSDPVCPVVRGIAEPYAGMVAARMRAIAAEAGVTLAPAPCRTNVSVNFVGDASALMREIDRRSPTRLQEVPRDEREAMLNGDAPIRWWYLTETRSRHRMRNAPQSLQTQAGSQAQAGGGAQSSGSLDVDSLQEYGSSMISTFGVRAIIDANVVIDLDRVEGRTLEAIGAYAAMVALAEVRPSQPPPVGSILGLFGADSEVRSLTDWDMNFLRALYALPLDRPARRHRGILVRDMVNFQTGS